MESNDTAMAVPVDVTIAAWLKTGPELVGIDAKVLRRQYNMWVHRTFQEEQRVMRSVSPEAFRSTLGRAMSP